MNSVRVPKVALSRPPILGPVRSGKDLRRLCQKMSQGNQRHKSDNKDEERVDVKRRRHDGDRDQ